MPLSRWWPLLLLMVAGEMIFVPVFHPGRFFRSTLLTALKIDEFQLGRCYSVYGVVAAIAYLLGGPLADRYSPRLLMPTALVATAAGLLYLMQIPGELGLSLLYGYWGLTTILLFWSALITATAAIGDDHPTADKSASPGRAFGWLDGGRGAVAAVIASGSAVLVNFWLSEEQTIAGSMTSDLAAVRLRRICWFYVGCCGVTAAAIALCLKLPSRNRLSRTLVAQHPVPKRWNRGEIAYFIERLWAIAVVILAAYCGFKLFDYVGLMLEDRFAMTVQESSLWSSTLSYLRIPAPILAGYLADRVGVARVSTWLLGFLAATTAAAAAALNFGMSAGVVIAILVIYCVAFFGLRGTYFALLPATDIDPRRMGVAVGVVSWIGFLPDVFFAPVSGYAIAAARVRGDVIAGYQLCFMAVSVAAIIGMTAAMRLQKAERRRPRGGGSDLG